MPQFHSVYHVHPFTLVLIDLWHSMQYRILLCGQILMAILCIQIGCFFPIINLDNTVQIFWYISKNIFQLLGNLTASISRTIKIYLDVFKMSSQNAESIDTRTESVRVFPPLPVSAKNGFGCIRLEFTDSYYYGEFSMLEIHLF